MTALNNIVGRLIPRCSFVRRWFRIPGDDFFSSELSHRILPRVTKQVFGDRNARSGALTSLELLQHSYAQHTCQMELMGSRGVRILQNLCAAFTLGPTVAFWLLRYFVESARYSDGNKVDVVAFAYVPYLEDLARGLRPRAQTVCLRSRRPELSPSDIWFAIRLFAKFRPCWSDCLFLQKAFFGIGYHSCAIRRYRPSEIMDFHEDFAGGSLQTAYCRNRGVKHVNAMHGDRARVIEYAFATYDLFLVWGDFYKEVFTSLSCPSEQFQVAGNPLHRSLFERRVHDTHDPNHRPCLLVCYEPLMGIEGRYVDLLAHLVHEVPSNWRRVFRCRIKRAHEQASGTAFVQALNARLVQEGQAPFEVESEADVSIVQSTLDADAVAAIYSTALLDAWVAGRKVIRLKSKAERFQIPEPPYVGSANFITYSEDSVLGDFLDDEFCFDLEESRLLNRISWQPSLVRDALQQDRRAETYVG